MFKKLFHGEKNKAKNEVTQRQVDLISEIDKGKKGFFYGDLEDDKEYKEYKKMQKKNSVNNAGGKSNSFEFIDHSDIEVDFENIKFRAKDKVSSGAYGDVYKLTDGITYDERYVAKKMPKFFLSNTFSHGMPKMFHKEVVAFRYLSDFGIVPKIIYADYDKRFYIMERLDKTLLDLLEDCKFEPKHVSPFIDLMCRITITPYRHNDFHSNNVMWSEKKGKFFFIDWGLFSLLDNTKPLKDYAYLSNRMPDLKPATKVYHKKDQPNNLHLKGFANHIIYYSLLLFKEREPRKWDKVFSEFEEYYALTTPADGFDNESGEDYETYMRREFAYWESECAQKKREGTAGIKKKKTDKKGNNKNKKKTNKKTDKKKTKKKGNNKNKKKTNKS